MTCPAFRCPCFLRVPRYGCSTRSLPLSGRPLNVTLLSYVDTCAIGINMDAAAIPDAEVFYDCLVAGFDDIVALAN